MEESLASSRGQLKKKFKLAILEIKGNESSKVNFKEGVTATTTNVANMLLLQVLLQPAIEFMLPF